MVTPKRVRLQRVRGYRKPEGAISVTRPGPYGNPFPVEGDWITWMAVGLGYHGGPEGRRNAAIALFRTWITSAKTIERQATTSEVGSLEFADGSSSTFADHCMNWALGAASLCEPPKVPRERPDLAPLRGHDLACYCPLDKPCHADVLLELANKD